MIKLNSQAILKQHGKELICSNLGDELIMMDMKSNSFFAFSYTARVIWEFLESDTTFQDLTRYISKRFNTTGQDYEKDLLECIETLYKANLISIRNK